MMSMHMLQTIVDGFIWGGIIAILLLIWASLLFSIFYGVVGFALYCRRTWRARCLLKLHQRYHDK